jgi:hypothetical protein
MMATELDVILTVAAIIQTLVVVIGAALVVHQIRQSTRARELQSLSIIFDGMTSEERSESLRQLLALPPDMASWTDAHFATADAEHQHFEQLGFYVRHGFLRERLVMEMYSLLIVNAWRALAEYEVHEASRMGAPRFGRSFRRLATRAVAYRSRKGLSSHGHVARTRRPQPEASDSPHASNRRGWPFLNRSGRRDRPGRGSREYT